jgi:hypothetical protein
MCVLNGQEKLLNFPPPAAEIYQISKWQKVAQTNSRLTKTRSPLVQGPKKGQQLLFFWLERVRGYTAHAHRKKYEKIKKKSSGQ